MAPIGVLATRTETEELPRPTGRPAVSRRYGQSVSPDAGSFDVTPERPSLAERRDAAVEHRFRTSDDGLRAAYDAYGGLIYRFCTRTLGPHAAQDATQEVFLTAWRQRDRFDPARGSLVGWLVGIARFRVLGSLRTDRRHPPPTGAIEDAVELTRDAVDGLADQLLVAQALEVLPERTRTAISLAYLKGLTHQEVADHMDVPLGTVKSDIRRGLERLRHTVGADHG